ncbi:MAG TPA: MYXO-CTERM sorting domain-containing protein [Myxococcus sp.]|nr:MYXO-CTERM sorting domain-containing protein [Myxococcus sp.]
MRLLFALLLLLAVPAWAERDSFGLGTGRDGALGVTTAGRVINVATPLTAAAPSGTTTLSVERSAGVLVGRLVLLHQSTGLPASTPSGGTQPVSPGGVGRWELARVASVADGSLQLTAPLVNGFTAPGAQVVAVPEFTSVTVQAGASLVAPPWNGLSGGILAFLATGTVTNQGTVSSSGAGFRGGRFVDQPAGLHGCDALALDLTYEQGGALKGEGLVVSRFEPASGRGNLANAGGGGHCHNGGGGGGGHGGAGGQGGRSSVSDNQRDVGGQGGARVTYPTLELDRFVFGGGAGAGEGNNNDGSSGGAGGGVVLVRANALAGSGQYSADGVTPPPTPGDDGAGGGGAGGAVMLRVAGTLACGGANARGGSGGNVTEPGFPLGPGGGGGGGYVMLQGQTVSCPLSVTGGAPGVNVAQDATYGTSYGAVAGSAGTSQQFVQVPYRTPTTPTVTEPAANATGVSSRPRLGGQADPGVRVFIYVDGAEVLSVGTDNQTGRFSVGYPANLPELSPGAHTLTLVAESLSAYSARSPGVTFTVALAAPVLVVPANGDTVGPTPLFAGVASEGTSTVGLVVDDREEAVVPVDSLGRFRYQVPASAPLPVGTHRVILHAHDAQGGTGNFSPETGFEVVAPPDAGTGEPDAGTGEPDAGTGGTPDGGSREVPILVLPGEGEVVDPTPLFAGVAPPETEVFIEVDGVKVGIVDSDTTGAFRFPLPADAALETGTHSVIAYVLTEDTPREPLSSVATGFQVRGPMALDVGCGCGASPAGVAGAWALLAGLAALVRRRRG